MYIRTVVRCSARWNTQCVWMSSVALQGCGCDLRFPSAVSQRRLVLQDQIAHLRHGSTGCRLEVCPRQPHCRPMSGELDVSSKELFSHQFFVSPSILILHSLSQAQHQCLDQNGMSGLLAGWYGGEYICRS